MAEHQVTTGITMEQLQAIMENQARMTKEIVAEAIKAAKAPTEEEAEKKAEDKARYERSRAQARANQEAEFLAKKQRQDNCSHKKENGKWRTGGQVIGGRYAVIVCQGCQKEWYKTFSPEVMSQLQSGDLVLFQADPAGWDTEIPQTKALTA